MKIVNFLRQVKRSFANYRPCVEVLISRERLINNLNEYKRRYPDLAFAPVLKSNAYGHGLAPAAKILDKQNIAFFVVDSLFEAKILRHEGIKSPILVIGYTRPENVVGNRLPRVSFAVVGLEQLRAISNKMRKMTNIHLKIDTGMRRQGVLPEELGDALKIIKGDNYLCLEGVCSHLADADNFNDSSFTLSQIAEWSEAVKKVKREFIGVKYFHLFATAGLRYSDKGKSNVARLGIGLYGINLTGDENLNLKPVLSMRSAISSVKKVLPGESVGYSADFKTSKPIKIAVVPAGYFEGVDRRLSNVGSFKIGAMDCPIVGRVSMNITIIDVSGVPSRDLSSGRAIIISDNQEDKNSVQSIAHFAQTIPYEILIHIPAHLRRIVV